jgi:hypothetical protein
LKALGINTALGVSVTGTRQLLRGQFSLSDIFFGALGGSLAFAGKRVAVECFHGAGLIGRQINALGTSLVDNAGSGQGAMTTLTFPLGPIRLHLRRTDRLRVQPRLDLASTVVTFYAATRPGMRWDPSASLSAGAMVYRTRGRVGGLATSAMHSAGVIWIEADEDQWEDLGSYARELFAHERVHALQYDLAQHWIGRPLQETLQKAVPAFDPIGRHLDLGLTLPLWGVANEIIPYQHRPWEKEAQLLMYRPPLWK